LIRAVEDFELELLEQNKPIAEYLKDFTAADLDEEIGTKITSRYCQNSRVFSTGYHSDPIITA